MPRVARSIPWLDVRDGVYGVNWYDPASPEQLALDPKAKGRTRRLGLRTRDPREAQARYAAFLLQGTDLLLRAGANGVTVAGALDAYIAEHVREKVRDQVRQENAARNLKDFFGTTPLRTVDIPMCRAYADARRRGRIGRGKGVWRRTENPTADKRASNGTIRRELTVLRAAAAHALRWKRITQAEFPTFEMPPERERGQEAPWFTDVETELLIAAAEGDMRDWLVLTYWWGARRDSVERLETYQVDLVNGRVNLQKRDEPVTNKRRPIVPIFAQQREILARRVAGAERGFLFGPSADFYLPFRRLCEELGFEEKAWPHVLRHSRATHMLMAGENPYRVARLLGDTLATIERVYGHHSPEFLAGK